MASSATMSNLYTNNTHCPSHLGMQRLTIEGGGFQTKKYGHLTRFIIEFSTSQQATRVFLQVFPRHSHLMDGATGKLDGKRIIFFVDNRQTEPFNEARQLIKLCFFPHNINAIDDPDVVNGQRDLVYLPPNAWVTLQDGKGMGFDIDTNPNTSAHTLIPGTEVHLKQEFPDREWPPFFKPIIEIDDRATIRSYLPFRWDSNPALSIPETDDQWAIGSETKLCDAIAAVRSKQ